MGNPFNFVKAITESRHNVLENGELDIDDYNSFIINRAISLRKDGLTAAEFANSKPSMNSKGQYLLLHSLVQKRKPTRDELWIKSEKNDTVSLLQKALGLSIKQAEELSEFVSPVDIENLKHKQKKFGEK